MDKTDNNRVDESCPYPTREELWELQKAIDKRKPADERSRFTYPKVVDGVLQAWR